MIFIIFDAEYTCWKGSLERNWSGDDEYKELIQLTAYKLELGKLDKLNIIDKISFFVKPYFSKLSDYCKNLTSINDTDIQNGLDLFESIIKFIKFCDDKPIFCWGHDNLAIINNISYYNSKKEYINLIKSNKFIDIRNIFKKYNIKVENYNSGSVYKSLEIKVNNDNIHNSNWDVYSLYLTLNYLNNKYNNLKKNLRN